MAVYFLLDCATNLIKVGMVREAQHVDRRIRQIKAMSNNDLHLMKVLPELGVEFEKKLHSFLKTKGVHAHHEWFHFNGRVAMFLRDLFSWRDMDKCFAEACFYDCQLERSWAAITY